MVISRSIVEALVIMNTVDDNLRARHIFFCFLTFLNLQS